MKQEDFITCVVLVLGYFVSRLVFRGRLTFSAFFIGSIIFVTMLSYE